MSAKGKSSLVTKLSLLPGHFDHDDHNYCVDDNYYDDDNDDHNDDDDYNDDDNDDNDDDDDYNDDDDDDDGCVAGPQY